MQKILIASNNSHKVEELQKILKDSHCQIIRAKDIGVTLPEVEEDQNSYEGNSGKKALEYSKITGYPCLADDSGLEVDALNGEPGIYSARWSGALESIQEANNKKLLELMQNVPKNQRQAKFVCVISLAYQNEIMICVRGECSGHITSEKQGTKGFGYDPLFVPESYNQTFAELGDEIKNTISHRAIALAKFREALERVNTP